MSRSTSPPPWAPFIAGGAGALVGGTITCPLEVIKTRLQALKNKEGLTAEQNPFGTRTWVALKHLYRENGIRSLYKGLMPHLVGVVPARAIYFGAFNTARATLEKHVGLNPELMFSNWVAACIAGIVTITVTSPIWFVKTRMQLQAGSTEHATYKNSLDCIRKVLKTEGWRAFFSGMTASYVGISESSIQFMLYEKFKKMRKDSLRRRSGQDKVELSPIETLGISSLSKLIASGATYPHEVVRTRMREEGARTKYRGFIDCLRVVYVTEGVKGLYGGLAPHLLRVVPNAAIMFATYEVVLSWFI
jgi:solute carrier family 25 protein 33/36